MPEVSTISTSPRIRGVGDKAHRKCEPRRRKERKGIAPSHRRNHEDTKSKRSHRIAHRKWDTDFTDDTDLAMLDACHSERATCHGEADKRSRKRVEESPEDRSDAKRTAIFQPSGDPSTRSSDSLAQGDSRESGIVSRPS